MGDAQARIDDTNASSNGLSARLDMLEAEVERLATENEDLAGRLATVQIRRLEAEKLLLEARIDWYRNQGAEGRVEEAGAGVTLPTDSAAQLPPRESGGQGW